ncbi:MAG: hypothetical protein A2430_02020 [Candidatus Liptonbacteria bacterium RIFOXYC1_FULL_36_8]|uniref:Glycosyl transferase family 1 domain-containing protein n=3 Tax=Candidatus Liptoniibacteriota TaxID=1817909 RepID=A0A1G2CMF8_9BACT|nr:MAG: hypothetical protein A2390_02750 [Candidatus Liptonbacteria bacterium RIFOXYB1_FULL_36_10]OGZ03479.1 MAG: hypothetical protein A2604_00705 [Candidatus Liptonbacteria bacterium RIFOXYD1_FULL_36_11]OGZ03506.1 MAG: hypothetical protein A2430_02020 [Candidatus Liptonbacteria bacterium RIFOXYC1_FULL_36_8]
MTSNLKINIFFPFKDSAWGGGNQFLKALRKEFKFLNIYEDIANKADVILFNSHQNLKSLVKLKKEFPSKIFIHRIDGPLYQIRNTDKKTDKLIYIINNIIADGTIFQSHWSKHENIKSGIKLSSYQKTIINAPDPDLFNTQEKKPFNKENKIKLIATSWSANPNKGFYFYQYLDENLDFFKYDMTFIGNSPLIFKNINKIEPLSSHNLSVKLKEYDIFITASKNDPCSNSLIEALHCGLPAVALNSGGHPEIIKKGGVLFNNKKDLIEKINKIASNYTKYQKNIKVSSLHNTAKKYYNFCHYIFIQHQNNKYTPKRINFFQKLLLLGKL